MDCQYYTSSESGACHTGEVRVDGQGWQIGGLDCRTNGGTGSRIRSERFPRVIHARALAYKNPKLNRAPSPDFFFLFICRFQIMVIPKIARAKSTKAYQPRCSFSKPSRTAKSVLYTCKCHVKVVRLFHVPALACRRYPKRLWW